MADFTDEELEEQVLNPEIRKAAREGLKAKRKVEELEAEIGRMKLVGVFDQLQIPTTGPGLLFREKYDGDKTAEAVKDAAYNYGVLQRPAISDPGVADELARLRASQSGSNDSRSDPVGDREAEWARRINSAQNEAELLEVYKEIEAARPA